MGEVAPKPGQGLGQGSGAGPVPRPKPSPASVPSPVPSPAAMPGARGVTPEQTHEQVATVLSAPVPALQERVTQFGRVHEILYETLGLSRKEGK